MTTDLPDQDALIPNDDYLTELDLPPVTDNEEEGLQHFAELVHETNQHTNLTGAKDLDTIWERHVVDSLYLVPLLKGDETLLDIGSGGGFPALPLAIMHPGVSVTMIESTGKKARFLNACAAEIPCPNARALPERAEVLAHDRQHRGRYDIVTARGVTSLAALIELSLPFLKVGGHLLAMKGRKAEEEIIAAENALDILHGETTGLYTYLVSEENEACVIRVTKMSETPRDYPRTTGIPAKMPL